MLFRIGIHVGDIMIDGDDIFGDGVNIAARLEGIAEPGGVCVSDDAYRQVRGKVDVSFEDMGSQQLKNIAASGACLAGSDWSSPFATSRMSNPSRSPTSPPSLFCHSPT